MNVAVVLRITPRDIDTDLEGIRERLAGIVKGYGKLHKTEIKPIAFGLNSVEATLLLNDSEGGMEEIEEKLKALDEVSQVDVLDVNRL